MVLGLERKEGRKNILWVLIGVLWIIIGIPLLFAGIGVAFIWMGYHAVMKGIGEPIRVNTDWGVKSFLLLQIIAIVALILVLQ